MEEQRNAMTQQQESTGHVVIAPDKFKGSLTAAQAAGHIAAGILRVVPGAGFFDDPFTDVDEYLRTLDRFAALGVDLINTGPHPGNPDPVGWVKRLGDEVITRLAS